MIQKEIMKKAKQLNIENKVIIAMTKFGIKYCIKMNKKTMKYKLSDEMNKIISGSTDTTRELTDGIGKYKVCLYIYLDI